MTNPGAEVLCGAGHRHCQPNTLPFALYFCSHAMAWCRRGSGTTCSNTFCLPSSVGTGRSACNTSFLGLTAALQEVNCINLAQGQGSFAWAHEKEAFKRIAGPISVTVMRAEPCFAVFFSPELLQVVTCGLPTGDAVTPNEGLWLTAPILGRARALSCGAWTTLSDA